MTVPRMTYKQFQSHFRLNVETFDDLLSKCYTVLNENNTRNKPGNPGLTLEKDLLICIWYLANLECFRSVADRFGVSKSTAWQSFHRMCSLILKVNTHYKIITFPEGDRIASVKQSFFVKAAMPNVVVAIDGSHIPICAPSEAANSYVNRKGFHSVLLQAVCDGDMIFTDCYAGEVGSLHDACVLRRSDLYGRLPNLIYPQDHIIGDSAFPLTNNLLVPYKAYGPLNEVEKYYNSVHDKTRVTSEQAFALLKGRFRRLKLLEIVKFSYISITMGTNRELEEGRMMNANEGVINDVTAAEGIRKRHTIARNIFNRNH